MWWWTSDLHLDHSNIIQYCNRPFKDVEEMDEVLIQNWNEVVGKGDNVIFAGDLTLHHKYDVVKSKYISRLNGNIIWIKGNHDYWMPKSSKYIDHRTMGSQFIVTSHYPMRSWNKSIHGSWNLHGHSHGMLEPLTNQYDVGVDNNNYYPVNLDTIRRRIKGVKD